MGFFYKNERAKKQGSKKGVGHHIETLHELRCKVCPLNKAALKHPKMEASGAKRPKVYILGEAPGKQEDLAGTQFVGDAGEYLRDSLPEVDLDDLGIEDIEDIIRFNNTIRCRPTKGKANRKPDGVEIECCRKFVEEDIEKSKPRVVIGTGGVPLTWMLNPAEHPAVKGADLSITAWRGRRIACKIGSHKFWFMPVYHPSYINRKENSREAGMLDHCFQLDLHNAFEEAIYGEDEPFIGGQTKKEVYKGVEYVLGKGEEDAKKVIRWLKELRKKKAVAIDIETHATPTAPKTQTMFNPFCADAKILTVAIGTYNKTYAFPLMHPKAWRNRALYKKVWAAFKAFLFDKSVKKIAQNLVFEATWFYHFFGAGIIVPSMWEDTLAQAHALDERKRMHNLDILCFINLGVDLKHHAGHLNKADLTNESLEDVLLYNGGDTKHTYKLFFEQQKRIRRGGDNQSYRITVESALGAAAIKKKGIYVDQKEMEKYRRKLTQRIKETKAKIAATPQAKRFKKKFRHNFSPTGRNDLVDMFHTLLQREECIKDDGRITTDERALSSIKLNLVKYILSLRNSEKLLGTYIDGVQDVVYPDGMLHPNINITIAETGRLSYDEPNGQNFPKRKDKWVRNVIAAPPGLRMLASDYGGIEARALAMMSQDPEFCKVYWEGFDIHQYWTDTLHELYPHKFDMVAEEFKLTEDKAIWKAYRDRTKNQWVFAQFYGSQWRSCAKAMNIPDSVAEELAEFFWETYAGVKQWQEDIQAFYEEHGYVETLQGRKRRAPLSYNQIINTPIQGTAGELVKETQNRLVIKALEEEDLNYVPILNVHDDLTFYLPDENKKFDRYAKEIAREMVMPDYEWMNIPLLVEMESGYRWGSLEGYKEFESAKDFGFKLAAA